MFIWHDHVEQVSKVSYRKQTQRFGFLNLLNKHEGTSLKLIRTFLPLLWHVHTQEVYIIEIDADSHVCTTFFQGYSTIAIYLLTYFFVIISRVLFFWTGVHSCSWLRTPFVSLSFCTSSYTLSPWKDYFLFQCIDIDIDIFVYYWKFT